MSTVEGFVAKLFVKNGKSGNGKPWTAYSLKLEDKNGQEIDTWFGCGFSRPVTASGHEVAEGDYIQFETVEENGRTNVAKNADNVAVVKRAKNPPARAGGNSGGGSSSGGNAQPNIHYQNSRTAAIELVGILAASDALPVTGGKNKGDREKRFQEITTIVDKLTVQFFLDLETQGADGQAFRLLATVADGRGEVHETDLPGPAAEAEPVTEEPSPEPEPAPEAPADDGDFE